MSAKQIVCEDLDLAIDGLRRDGFRLDVIYPADDPKSALLSRAGERICVSLADAPSLPDGGLPPFEPAYILTRPGAASARGRAAMLYRDLIPGRLGGRYIASHIQILEGGPVNDWVHYHRVALQVIVVRRGWVRVVYEDHGDPFVMNPGDLVLQPPGIRHRVLESSPGLEVIEISAPALHETFADHELALPNGTTRGRAFGAQRFLRHVASSTPWTKFGSARAQESGLAAASGGVADLRIVGRASSSTVDFAPHSGELVFGFVMEGSAGLANERLEAADSFVIPPDQGWSLGDMSEEFQLLHLTTARLDASASCLL